MKPIYMDHNVTTPLWEEVFDAMLPYLREHFGNASSLHSFGIRAREAIEEDRASCRPSYLSVPGEARLQGHIPAGG